MRKCILSFSILNLLWIVVGCGGGGSGETIINVITEPNAKASKIIDAPQYYGYYDPEFSPDGKKIVFTFQAAADSLDTTGIHRTAGTSPISPQPQLFIRVADKQGTNVKQLTDNTNYSTTPSWAPDGNSIVYVSNKDESSKFMVWKMASDGTQKVRLSDNAVTLVGYKPSWSTSGKIVYITYTAQGGFSTSIVISDGINGNIIRKIEGHQCFYAVMSHDETRIAAICKENQERNFVLMNSDGTGYQIIKKISAELSWSPDDKRICYACGMDICIYDIQNNLHSALNLGFEHSSIYDPDWSEDGKYIIFSTGYAIWFYTLS